MKKENKKMAQEKRAKERARKQLMGRLKIVGAVVIIVALIAVIVLVADKFKEPVKEGDIVNIDFVGYIDGEEFEGGSTNGAGTNLEIGSNTYIDGFEEGIIGHKVGETFDLNLTFPENYGNEQLNGKDVVFKVTINKIVE